MSALVYGDLLLRDRGERYDFTARIDAGYTQNLVTTFGGNQDRTTAAYVEVTDRTLGLTGRVGRQSLASQGVIGLFDGVYVGYQVNPRLTVSAAAGFPAYTSYSPLSSQQKFGTVTAEYGPFHQAWVFDAYLIDETDAGATERRAVGLQTRYSEPGRSAVHAGRLRHRVPAAQLADADRQLKVGQDWVIGFDADHRRSPLLQLSNALIGQSAPDLRGAAGRVHALADPPAGAGPYGDQQYLVYRRRRPIGERWQFMADVAALQLSGTPASGGVAATTSTGLDKNIACRCRARACCRRAICISSASVTMMSPIARSETLSWDARFVLPGAWRFGPRFSVERARRPGAGRQAAAVPAGAARRLDRPAIGIRGHRRLPDPAAADAWPASRRRLRHSQRHLYISAAYRYRF